MAETSLQSTDGPSKGVRGALVVFCLLVLAYSVVVAGQILLGVLLCVLVFGLYLSYRLLGAFARFVDAFERVAAALEELADSERTTGTRERERRRESDGVRADADGDRIRDDAADRR